MAFQSNDPGGSKKGWTRQKAIDKAAKTARRNIAEVENTYAKNQAKNAKKTTTKKPTGTTVKVSSGGGKSSSSGSKSSGSAKTKAKTTTKKSTTTTKSAERTLAEQLAKSKYAPMLEELNRLQESNRKSYDTGTQQRIDALNRELGSMDAAEATALKQLSDLKGSTATSYQQAMASSQQNSAQAQVARNQQNSNMLSSLEAEARQRGLTSGTGGSSAEAATQLGAQDANLQAINAINQGSLERSGQLAQNTLTQQEGMTKMSSNTARSGARGDATKQLDQLYNTYLSERQGIEGQRAVKLLEKEDYSNQTYLTLKDKKEQAEALAAQQAFQQQIALGNLNYKNTALQVNTQYKYDKMASDVARANATNELKRQGLSQSKAKAVADLAIKQGRLDLDWAKFDWSKVNPNASAAQILADAIGSSK